MLDIDNKQIYKQKLAQHVALLDTDLTNIVWIWSNQWILLFFGFVTDQNFNCIIVRYSFQIPSI